MASDKPMVTVNFKADVATVEAIEKITAATPNAELPGGRSFAIRRALLDVAARIDANGGELVGNFSANFAQQLNEAVAENERRLKEKARVKRKPRVPGRKGSRR